MSGRVLRHETVRAAAGSYTGLRCPHEGCQTVVQAVAYNADGTPAARSEALALRRHETIVHPDTKAVR